MFHGIIKKEPQFRTCSLTFRNKTGVTLEAVHYLRLSKYNKFPDFLLKESSILKKSSKMISDEASNVKQNTLNVHILSLKFLFSHDSPHSFSFHSTNLGIYTVQFKMLWLQICEQPHSLKFHNVIKSASTSSSSQRVSNPCPRSGVSRPGS